MINGPGEPWLHAIVASRVAPSMLENVVIYCAHNRRDNTCCREVVGTSEEVASSHQRLPELLSGLKELTIRFSGDDDLERCATYMHSVLPNMRKDLRFEYPALSGAWVEYTSPVAR